MSDQQKMAELIAARRAEVLAKMASFQSKAAAQTKAAPPPRPKVPVSVPNSISSWRPPPLPVNIPQPVPEASTGGLNLLELKKRIAETKARMGNAPASAARGVTPVVDTRGNGPQVALDESGNLDLKAMLDRGIIPKRENALAKPAPRPAAPKKELKVLKLESPPEELTDPTKNPYFDPSLIAKTAPVSRRARSLKFVRPGKYIQQANQERAKAQLEKLKQEISENVKKAGMEVELDISDKAIKKEPPPAIEWWDAPFMPNKTYSDLDTQPVNPDSLGALVTLYVHHPIPIKPPSELTGPAVSRSLMLTKKERKKLRRQQRQETQKEKQDKIRLGLLPPDPPKVKISNLMRVLGDEAIQDPTKIEAKVRKEMELRQKQHETANEQRKLTPAERRAKIANKLKNDQKISNEVAVFKVKKCSHPKLRYKIELNAQQNQLSGMVIVHPKCNLVIVEGGPKGIKAYKKLMLRRIDWNDMPPPKNGPLEAMDVDETEENACYLVWEGQVKNKAFKKFTWRSFESEKMAREELSKWHVEHYWDAALLANEADLAARQPEL